MKKAFSKELLYLIGLLVDSFSVSLMAKASIGLTPMSSFPYAISLVLPYTSFGTMNFLVQAILLLILILITRQPKKSYIFSFIISIVYGVMVDIATALVVNWPINEYTKYLYFLCGWLGIAFGVACTSTTLMPLMPFDAFFADISRYFKIKIGIVKTIADVSFILGTISCTYLKLGKVVGVGAGTVIATLFTGFILQKYMDFLKKISKYECKTKIGTSLVEMATIIPKE